MPFHVEISRGVTHARVFNFDDARLRREVLEPWMQGRPVELGDKQWIPADCELRILEGPELGPNELNFGRGWDSAEHTARDVTVPLLRDFTAGPVAGGEVAVLAETPWGQKAAAEALQRLGASPVEWLDVRDPVLQKGREANGLVAVLATESPEPAPWWLFEAGLAIGALGRRAIVVGLSAETPEPLRALGVVKVDPEDPSSLQPLAKRLQLAGVEL